MYFGPSPPTPFSLDTEWALVEEIPTDGGSFLLVGYGKNDFEKGSDLGITLEIPLAKIPFGVPVDAVISVGYYEFDGMDVSGMDSGTITVVAIDGETLTASFAVSGPGINITGNMIETGPWVSP